MYAYILLATMEGQQSSPTRELPTKEVVQGLLNEVAQFRADKVVMQHQIDAIHESSHISSVSHTSMDSAAAAFLVIRREYKSFFNDLATAGRIGSWSEDQTLIAKLKVMGDAKRTCCARKN